MILPCPAVNAVGFNNKATGEFAPGHATARVAKTCLPRPNARKVPARTLSSEWVTAEVLGFVEDPGLKRRLEREGRYYSGTTPLDSPVSVGPLAIDSVILERGYARYQPAGFWKAWLGGTHAAFFTSPVFGSMHRFKVIEPRGPLSSISFCPPRKGNSWIQGFMEMDEEGDVRRIRWVHFLDGEVLSGGEATFNFLAADPAARRFFLPDWSRTWRATGRTDSAGNPIFAFGETEFLSWSIDGRRVFSSTQNSGRSPN